MPSSAGLNQRTRPASQRSAATPPAASSQVLAAARYVDRVLRDTTRMATTVRYVQPRKRCRFPAGQNKKTSPPSSNGTLSGSITVACVARKASGLTGIIFCVVALWMNSRVGQPWRICQTRWGANRAVARNAPAHGQGVRSQRRSGDSTIATAIPLPSQSTLSLLSRPRPTIRPSTRNLEGAGRSIRRTSRYPARVHNATSKAFIE